MVPVLSATVHAVPTQMCRCSSSSQRSRQIYASHVYTVLYYDPYICAHVKPTDIHLWADRIHHMPSYTLQYNCTSSRWSLRLVPEFWHASSGPTGRGESLSCKYNNSFCTVQAYFLFRMILDNWHLWPLLLDIDWCPPEFLQLDGYII